MSTTDRPEALRIEVAVAAPVDVVWQALRDPGQIRRWHGWNYDGLDAEVELIFRTGAHETDRPYALEIETDDVFELEPTDAGTTLVRIIRSQPDPSSEWAAHFPDITEGWISFVHQLRFMLERHPAAERRTLFFQTEHSPVPLDTLVSTSPAAGGPTWFTSANQRGLVVDSLGPGLAVVGVKPADDNGAMTILTTYGLDDQDFDRTRARWSDWWLGHHPGAPAPVE
jgi:uncharacterized protein YndB with AHSA1/START domain